METGVEENGTPISPGEPPRHAGTPSLAEGRSESTPRSSVIMDAVRGLAALVVMVGHVKGYFFSGSLTTDDTAKVAEVGTQAVKKVADESTTWGHQMVIVFFVLSGYLVGGSVLRAVRTQNWSWKSYLINRMSRLWVVLIPAIVATLILDRVGLSMFGGQGSIYDGPVGQTQLLPGLLDRLTPSALFGNIAFVQDIFVPPFGSNLALWSLAYEFWYYVLFPIFILAATLLTGAKRWGMLVLGLLLLAFIGPKMAIYFGIWLMGAAVAHFKPKLSPSAIKGGTIAGLIVFLVINGLVRVKHLPVTVGDYVIGVAFALWLVAVVQNREQAKSAVTVKVSRFISEVSYSLYVTHMPFATLMCALLLHPWKPYPSVKSGAPILLAVTFATFVYAIFFYWCFEARTKFVRSWLVKKFETAPAD